MLLNASRWLLPVLLVGSSAAFGDEPVVAAKSPNSSKILADWIDAHFDAAWQAAKVTPPAVADDATFLKRVFLDLTGSVPSVSHAREFLGYEGPYKREVLVERLLNETRRPDKYAERTAGHWATLWRRMMVPGNSREAQAAIALEPWLKEQLTKNVPYDEIARRVITAKNDGAAMPAANPRAGLQPNGPAVFFQVTGGKPETSASAVSRIFLGVRVGCAECHDHPFAKWKQKDFWGMAAFFAGVKGGAGDVAEAKIRAPNGTVEYTTRFLDGDEAKIPSNKTSREVLADWIVAPENPLFAATAVNRVWMYLLGRGLTESVDDLDRASAEERRFLDQLALKFVEAKYDIRWLIAGISKSQVYQRECVSVDDSAGELPPGFRVVKTLTPEQIYNSLEQALALPVARADAGARYNGQKDQFISRMNEAATNQPETFRGGIPQALLLMNGKLTTEATDLEQSRTLRGVLEAPFLTSDEKLTTLYLAAFSRSPRTEEKQFLMEHVARQPSGDKQSQAFSEIFWSLLNSPEFVLEK